MSADNRSTHTDALAVLGTIIDKSVGRDAIHLAVEPVIAAETLHPGEHIGFNADGEAIAADGIDDRRLGIVDPFLDVPVAKGERFLLIVYPRQITSLRHVWSHPEFPEEGVQA